MNQPITINQIFKSYDISEYDYIGMVLTPWHAYSAKAALSLIQNYSKKELFGLMFILRNHGEDYILDESYFDDINVKIIYVDPNLKKGTIFKNFIESMFYTLFRYKNNNKENFYILTQQKPFPLCMSYINKYCNGFRNIVSVICDEGVGSYLNDDDDRLEQRNSKNFFKNIKRYLEQKLVINNLEKKLINTSCMYNYCLFKHTNNGLIVNSEFVETLKQIMYAHANYMDINIPTINQDYVLINTQPFTNEEVPLEIINNFWNNILKIYKSLGYTVYIKPHPREKDLERYRLMGAKLIEESSIAQELLLMKMKRPQFLVSIYSTTLITAPIFNDVDTVCLAPLFRKNKSVSSELLRSIDKFIETFKNNTVMVENLDELEVKNGEQ